MKFKALLTLVAVCSAIPALAQQTDAVFDSNGVKIRYVTAGDGEPVVLIHGWMSDSSMWGVDSSGNTKLSPLPGFQVIALDCRGHGKSDKLYDQKQYGIEMAEDVVRLLDHLKIKKAHLIGYSMGAFIVGNIAATHPDRLLSVVYGGQAPLIAGVQVASTGSNEVEIFAKAVEEGKGLGPYLLAVLPSDRPKPTLEQANRITNLMYGKKDVKAWAAAGLSLDALEVTSENLRKCKAPALFIYGSKESQHTRDRVAAARKVIGSEEKIIEGADHITALAKPEFGATIVEFIRSHKSGASRG